MSLTPGSSPFLADLAQTDPGLSILRLASLLAESGAKAEDQELDLLFEQTEAGFLLDIRPKELWTELERGLMGKAPGLMVENLRQCGALAQILPEVSDLFGVPQLSVDPATVDIGEHLCRALDAAALAGAPLAVRFGLLAMNVGKADSPREHLPVHYKHVDRGGPRIDAIADRFGVAEECRALAQLALAECERVHRISKTRAGPLALMLERIGAFDDVETFERLLLTCVCDYRAHPGHSELAYPKAVLIETAMRACLDIAPPEPAQGEAGLENVREARAAAIAKAFRSSRWSQETE